MLDSLFGDLTPRRLPDPPAAHAAPAGAADLDAPGSGAAAVATRCEAASVDVVIDTAPADAMRRHFAAERAAGLEPRPMLTLLDPARGGAAAVLRTLAEAGGQPLQRLHLRDRATLRTLAVIERTLVPRRAAQALRVYHTALRPGAGDGHDGAPDTDGLPLALAEASQLTAVVVGALQPHALVALLRELLAASHGPHWRGQDLVFLLPPSAGALARRILDQPWPAGLRVQALPEPLGTAAALWNAVLAAWERAQGPAPRPGTPPAERSPAGHRAQAREPNPPARAAAPAAAAAGRPQDPPLPGADALARLLQPLARSEGLLGCGVVDLLSGDLLASQCRGPLPADLETLALALCTARQAHVAVGRAAALPDEVLITTGPHQCLLRTLPGEAALGFVAVLDRAQSNLALLRFRLLDSARLPA